jgi:serine/threonine protein phosphatase PrpC
MTVSEMRTLAPPLFHAAARTDPGRVRANNEDVPLFDPARGIFGVIDGMGGEAAGEVAAAIARDVILQRLARPVGTPAERVREAIAIANNEIFSRAQESPELNGMACVITLGLAADGRLVVGHVGDSRLYKLRGGTLRKLTPDHSPVGEREDAGELSEADAMRHPRRHEVFRDVGTIHRDKDEAEFVDVIDEPLESDAAILVCSDGLSDMVPSGVVTRIVRQHAGNPAAVVEALVAAANEAGGKDNVTVVYAEGAEYVASLNGGSPRGSAAAPAPPVPNGAPAQPKPAGGVSRAARGIVRSRTTWFVTGVVLGVLGALALMFYVARTQVQAPVTRVVSTDGSGGFLRIADGLAAARPGDTVRVEPGEYPEFLVVPEGVDLVARLPGTVTISRPVGLDPAMPGIVADGGRPTRISGVHVTSVPELPGAAGVRIGGTGVTLDLVRISGAVGHAIALTPGASVALQGSRVEVPGAVIAVPDGAQASFSNNIFVRSGGSAEPPISAGPAARLTLTGNVFTGFSPEIVRGVGDARRRELLAGNLVVPPPAPQAPPRRAPARGRQ